MASDVVPHELTSLPAIDTTSTQPYPTSPAQPSTASPTSVDVTSSVLATLLAPFANTAPAPPVEAPQIWTLLAFAHREFERNLSNQSPDVNPLAGHIQNGIVTETPTLNSQSIDPAITDETAPTDKAWRNLTANPLRPAPSRRPATYTGYTIARVAGLHRGVPDSDFGHRLHGHLRCGRSDTDIAADSE